MEDRIALERFLLENDELEQIETFLAEFNVFQTLDVVRAEIRHSNVLAWLMNPKSNHGFGDQFLRLFLKYVFANNRETIKSDITLFDIEVLDLDDIEIRREWNRIDLIVISESNRLVVAVENKIEAWEHGSQLKRYQYLVTKEFPNHHRLFIYLTPESLTPSDTENWTIFDYSTIYSILMRLLESRKNSLGSSVYDFLTQYCTILRRYVMPNSEIEDICKKIYQKHQQALDLIFQYKPDMELEVSEIFQELAGKYDSLVLDTAGKTFVRFASKKLDEVIPKKGLGWVSSNRILLFEFNNYSKRGVLRLYIGPGDSEIRNRLHTIAKMDTRLFNISDRRLRAKWLALYQKEYLKAKDYDESDAVELRDIISKKLDDFVSGDLPRIEKHMVDNWSLPLTTVTTGEGQSS
jgi:hypothetical protein